MNSQRFQLVFVTAVAACLGFAAQGSDSTEANDIETVKEIHKFILSKSEAKTESEMKAYTNTIPGTSVKYSLVPIPGGQFVMGSPDNEPERKPDEGPAHKVKVD